MTTMTTKTASPQLAAMFDGTKRLTTIERLTLAKLLLESILAGESESEEANWSAMGLDAFQREWDNADDAIYDDWRELYDIPAR